MLPVVLQDKANHYIYGSLISVISMVIMYMFLDSNFEHNSLMFYIAAFGIISSAIMGTLKELHDLKSNKKAMLAGQKPANTVELSDIIYTVIGGVIPTVPVVLVHVIEILAS